MSDKIAKEPEFVIKTNPDADSFKAISEAIRQNGNYCCCGIEKTADTMCICKNFREQTESGFCHCGRFLKVKDKALLSLPHIIQMKVGIVQKKPRLMKLNALKYIWRTQYSL